MSQDNPQISTTPPLPGLQFVQDLNKALQTLATNFSGATDPAATAWPYSTWADTGTGTLKRRNAANSAWAIEGRLLRSHLPIFALADVPAQDIGPIYIIDEGPAEWGGSEYVPYLVPASETVPGLITIATADMAEAMVNDTAALTPAKLADAFTGNQSAQVSGYQILPGGLIRQWGTSTLSPVGAFNSQSVGGVTWYTHFYVITLPIAYTASHYSVVATIAGRSFNNQGPEILSQVNTNKNTTGSSASLTEFTLSITTPGTGWTPFIHWMSVGK